MACDVLVLDDDPLVLMTMVELLRDEGFDVAQAASSDEAFRRFREGPAPTVLVTDLNLGESRTGADVARELREEAPSLPVIFVTGRPDYLAGHTMDPRQRLLRKPVSVSTLAAVIREFQSALRVEEAPAAPATVPSTVEAVPLYRSASGDDWSLLHDPQSGTTLVRHVPNAASGGRPSDTPLETFLAENRSGPEHQAARDWQARHHPVPLRPPGS
ncbi:MAG: response regulator [Gluconacetobacter diazotrophicus]|nr:response regulator [Gluconacetobacter diazotrophicus]